MRFYHFRSEIVKMSAVWILHDFTNFLRICIMFKDVGKVATPKIMHAENHVLCFFREDTFSTTFWFYTLLRLRPDFLFIHQVLFRRSSYTGTHQLGGPEAVSKGPALGSHRNEDCLLRPRKL